MAIPIAINGAGRIGWLLADIFTKGGKHDVVAINDPGFSSVSDEQLEEYFQEDSIHQDHTRTASVKGDRLTFNGQDIKLTSHSDPLHLGWREHGRPLVIECSGRFTDMDSASQHLRAGASQVIVSAPGEGMKNIVYGVNHEDIEVEDTVISAASCTTNATAPIVYALLESGIKIDKGFLETIHAYTNTQTLLDTLKGAAGAINISESTTGAAKALPKVIPGLGDVFKAEGARSERTAVACGSILNLTMLFEEAHDADDINDVLKQASDTYLKDVMDYRKWPVNSAHLIGMPVATRVGLNSTFNDGNLAKVRSGYCNEFSYASQVKRLIDFLVEKRELPRFLSDSNNTASLG